MKLKSAEIDNFRSVKNIKINFMHGCEIFIGINESGKSNILRALQLLDPNTSISENDLRIERQNEDPVSGGYVRFEFQLDSNEIDEIYGNLAKKFSKNSVELPLITVGSEILTLRQFVTRRSQGLYKIELPSGKRTASYWSLPQNGGYNICSGWKKAKGSGEIKFTNTKDSEYALSSTSGLASARGVEDLIYEAATATDMNNAVGAELIKVVNSKLPESIYWRYSEQYLLPSSINLEEFCSDPNTCLPLKSMFELAGIKPDQVGPTLTSARLQPAHRYLHLLTKVAKAATAHLHEIWKDHKGVQIELRSHGEKIIPVIVDHEIPLDMLNRSDGFKRFVSFLLLVSAKVRTSQVENYLILVDEPEIGLHPRSARNLMQELIRIGGSNTVAYSTHSIFMIDRENIDRHFIVEKKNETTEITRASKSKVQDEEVLYGAVGYSVFETLQQKNVIFEGWKDKQVFKAVRDFMAKESKGVKLQLEEIGLTFAEGVKDVRHVSRFLELANRGCLIISDGDKAGLQWQREYRKEGGWGTWVTLPEIMGIGTVVTSEDLLTHEAILKRANSFRKKDARLGELTESAFKNNEPTMKVLADWIGASIADEKEQREVQSALKDALFDKLKRDDLLDSAKKLIEFVLQHDFAT